MQYPKQSDTTFQSQEKTFKREEQPISERERAKLEGRNEAEDEHMSQPSTLHSLGNLDESISPGNTPRSMEILQKGFHKATDTIAQGVEIVKNILTYSGEKATQTKETVGEKVSGFEGDIKQKAEQAKSKLTEEFGEEIQPEKDLDPEMKEQVKEVNEEIKHHPHGEEQIVEGQGLAQDKPKSFESKESDVSSQKTGEMKEKLGSKIENLKEGSKGMVDKAAGKLDEMKEKTSQQVQPLKEQAQNLPDKGYEEKEQPREKDITKDDDLRTVSKDILDKALDKIEEMKDSASQKGEQIKQDVKQASSQISEKAEQKTSQFSESKSQSESQHVEAQPGDQPLTKEAKEEILDLAQQITDKVQELKASGQLSTEQKWQSSHFESQTGSTSLSHEGQEGHEHHHQLSAESPSFIPTKQSHQLYEKVKEGLDESVPLTEKIEEFEHKKPADSSQFQQRGHSAMESLKQGPQNISNKISEKVQDVKGSLAPSGQQSSGAKQESYQPQERGQALSGQKENLQSQERGQPALDTLKQGAQDLSNKFSQKVQDIKSNLAPSGQQSGEFKQDSSQYQERGQPLSSQMKQGAQEAQSKFYEKKEDFKDKLAPSEQRPSGYQQEGFQSQERGQPLSSQVKQGVQEASNKLSEKMEDVKDKFAPSGQKPSEFKQESFQSQERGQPLSGQMKQGVQEAQSKFYEKKEDFKDKLAPSDQQPSEFKQESFQSQKRGQPLSGQIKQGVQEASNKLSEKMEDVKNKLAPSGQESSEFKQDFSQSGSQPQEKPQLKGNVEQASEKLSEKVQEVKQDITQKKEEILEERKPLVDKIMGRIHGVTDDFHQRVEGVKNAFRIEEKPHEEQSQREPLVDIVQKGITDMTSKISHNIEAVKSKVMPAHHERSSQESLHFRQAKPEEGVSLKEKISQGVSDIKNRFKSEKGEEKFHKIDADEGFYETVEEYRQEQSEPPLVSSNPYETLGTKNLTLAQPLGPQDVVGGNLKELTSNVDTENLHLSEEYIYHPTMIEKIKEGFKAKFGKGEEEEGIVEEVQAGSQSLKQKISGRIESLKDKFHHGKEEVQQQATEKISEKKPLEQPLEAAKQEGKSLKGKAEEKISENKPFEQPLEQLSGASESKSFKEVIGAPFQAIKGKFHHEKEEVQQQASEKISEKKPLEQPLEAAKQEGKSLKGKVEEKISESKPIEKSFEQPLEQLSEAAESRSFKEVIGAPFQSIKGKLHHEREEVQQQASEKISEVKPLEKSLEQPLEADKQEGKSLKEKAEEKISENKPFQQPLKQLIEASESKTLKEVISAPFQSISSKIAVEVGSIQGKYLSEKKQVKEGVSQKFEEIQSLDQPSGQSGQQESGEFHTVKEGIRETLSELKEEQSVEPLLSSNPFVPLESKGGDIAQPLNPQDIVGGDLQDLTQGVGEENIEKEESSLTGESKSLLQKISGGFHEGLESMKAKFRKEKEPLEEQDINISEKFNITKEKAESGFTHYYKENMALLGVMKDIEDKCKPSQNESNENA